MLVYLGSLTFNILYIYKKYIKLKSLNNSYSHINFFFFKFQQPCPVRTRQMMSILE